MTIEYLLAMEDGTWTTERIDMCSSGVARFDDRAAVQNARVRILHAAADLRMTRPRGRVHSQPGRIRVAWALERAAEILSGICGDIWLDHDPHCPFCAGKWA